MLRSSLKFICLSGVFGCTKGDDTGREVYGNASDTDLLHIEPDTGFDDGSGVLGSCDTVLTKVNGRSADTVANPQVGDEWIVRMFCDGALLTGANRLFFQPANVAVINDTSTDATFVAQGTSLMTMQSGNFIYTKEFTVEPAD